MAYRQCKFKKGSTYQTAFVEDKPSLKIGALIELKSDDKTEWEVVEIGDVKHEKAMVHTWQM